MRTFLLLIVTCLVAATSGVSVAAEPTRMEWTVAGVKREALVFAPSKPATDPPPLVFGFHGHGGHMRYAARSFRIHELWPEAVVVYMQGLNTPGRLTDPEGKKPGWQSAVGDQEDRDLKFFDAVLKSMKDLHKIDERRVYAMGHSNGGGFTYLLWAARGDLFAAVAPSASVAARLAKDLKPKPVMHIAGEQDELVKFAWQQATITRLRMLNDCGEGTPWHDHKLCTVYASKSGNPVVTMIHPGTHKFPEEAPPLIVKFFQEQRRER
jgi:polyhydroxybutyrate depolymerase